MGREERVSFPIGVQGLLCPAASQSGNSKNPGVSDVSGIAGSSFVCCPRQTEKRVRDIFCFLCYTGLRFSELQRLKKPDIDLDRAEVHVKGKHTRTLPLNGYAAEIVQRYENKYYAKDAAFPVMSLVTFNKHLKNLGKALGFDRMVADREGREAPLFAQLAAGTAINTFIANAIRLGVSGEVIRYYTGVAEKKRLESIRESLMEEARDRFDRHKAISPGDREDIR
ncbi:MAG: tyrosine-type recombinase/integrase [Bacteroidales bacterium]